MSEPKIQVQFTIEENGFSYTDALYFTLEEYSILTPEKIEAMKRTRFDSWLEALNVANEPTEEINSVNIRLAEIKNALAIDDPVMNSVLDAAMQIVPNVETREELRTALLELE